MDGPNCTHQLAARGRPPEVRVCSASTACPSVSTFTNCSPATLSALAS
ncbi:hypothetical protein I552_4346 [Mycobacterium xenopi 3993]|nr:hypothetical protein I552_4346 [Mycobacterium xenopi 3993]